MKEWKTTNELGLYITQIDPNLKNEKDLTIAQANHLAKTIINNYHPSLEGNITRIMISLELNKMAGVLDNSKRVLEHMMSRDTFWPYCFSLGPIFRKQAKRNTYLNKVEENLYNLIYKN